MAVLLGRAAPRAALFLLLATCRAVLAVADPTVVSALVIPGTATDLYVLQPGETGSANTNRLAIGSDAFYDFASNILYTLADRGPGGGLLSYKVCQGAGTEARFRRNRSAAA